MCVRVCARACVCEVETEREREKAALTRRKVLAWIPQAHAEANSLDIRVLSEPAFMYSRKMWMVLCAAPARTKQSDSEGV